LCHPFDIGTAPSLPWNVSNGGLTWVNARTDYDVTHLVADTLSLLTPTTPIVVRMETLRRATIYATRDRLVAASLLKTLNRRAVESELAGHPDALAIFDLGYMTEALVEIVHIPHSEYPWPMQSLTGLVRDGDAYPLLIKSLSLRPDDPAIQFAAALMSLGPAREQHTQKAKAAASRDPLVRRNLHYLS
jgi:hypothetical protein